MHFVTASRFNAAGLCLYYYSACGAAPAAQAQVRRLMCVFRVQVNASH